MNDRKDIFIFLLSVCCCVLVCWLMYVYHIEIDNIRYETERRTEIRVKRIYEDRELSKPHSIDNFIYDKDGFILPPLMD